MSKLLRYCMALATVLALGLSGPVRAGDDLETDGGESVRKLTRQESLELPGLTACHQCEWRPSAHTMAAGERCGYDEAGKANVAVFECGFSQDCKRVCNFMHCGGEVN